MKKSFILFLSILVTVLIIVALNVYAGFRVEKIEAEQPLILKQEENHLTVYRAGKEIEKFTSVNFSALPEFDRNTLKKGIPFDNMEQVYSAIEDFDG